MSTSEPVIGNLPLLHLPPQRVSKLSGQLQWDYMEQLRHQCIRLAWLKATQSGLDLRAMLDLTVGRAFTTYSVARGYSPTEVGLSIEMEHARRENELWTCFGFFLEGEINHLVHRRVPGPILQTLLPDAHEPLGVFVYSSLLAEQLRRFRAHIRGNLLARETAQLVSRISEKPSCLWSTPPTVAAYLRMGQFLQEAIADTAKDDAQALQQSKGT